MLPVASLSCRYICFPLGKQRGLGFLRGLLEIVCSDVCVRHKKFGQSKESFFVIAKDGVLELMQLVAWKKLEQYILVIVVPKVPQ